MSLGRGGVGSASHGRVSGLSGKKKRSEGGTKGASRSRSRRSRTARSRSKRRRRHSTPGEEHLCLDSERSWVILEEVNIFTWRGFDLRPIKQGESRVDYGLSPPELFECLITKLREPPMRTRFPTHT